ncbi:MAG: hypothetical protein V1827_01725 [Candidatus Micrarchaeota archaeon]
MTKSITEFREELRALRYEMSHGMHKADAKMLASWIDKLVISLEGFTETMDMFNNELEVTEECCCSCCEAPPAKPAKKAAGAKKAKAKKRR